MAAVSSTGSDSTLALIQQDAKHDKCTHGWRQPTQTQSLLWPSFPSILAAK